MKKSILFILSGLLLSTQAWAHAIWIESAPAGSIGKVQEVKVFFGEYSEHKPEKAGTWFSDLGQFSLWLVKPGNRQVKLETKAAADHYTAQFTPEEEGTYQLVIKHEVKDVYESLKILYNSLALVQVGKGKPDLKAVAAANTFGLVAGAGLQARKPVRLQLVPSKAEAKEIIVVTPAGSSLKLVPGADGTAEFTPEVPGNYFIEASYSEKAGGTSNGKLYTSKWHAATALVTVK